MNCDWEFTDQVCHEKPGWRYVRCTRRGCGIKGGPTPHGLDNITNPAGCNGWPRWWEWGNVAEFVLGVIGINERRFNALRRLLGFVQPCKCGERIGKLNESGGWLRDRWEVAKRLLGRQT